ncbi:MAG: hydrogenase maturation protease [Gemmatimonadetes bacterium]|nr:hydrogenase maturation protease [Gemmatimonadota bacterium]
MSAHVVLLGYGNPSRGDDALGPALLTRVRQWIVERPDLDVRVVEDFQLQVEHALDLVDADLVLFVDADASAHAPFCLRRTKEQRDTSYTTHELSPEAVLHVVHEITGSAPPPAWVLGVRGEQFTLGEEMSVNALGHLEVAWDELLELLNDPRPQVWDARAAGW